MFGRWHKNKVQMLVAISTVFVLLATINVASAVMTSNSGYIIWSDNLAAGGGEDPASAGYALDDSVSEDGAGQSASSLYTSKAGYREQDLYSGTQTLTFSVSASTLDFGELSATATKTATHTATVGTNSPNGVSVTFVGATLTSGSDTITALGATGTASAIGSSQFGFNVVYSSGTSPVASAASPYNNASLYAFNTGDSIISASAAVNNTVFDVNYIANISDAVVAGTYTTSIAYTATANF